MINNEIKKSTLLIPGERSMSMSEMVIAEGKWGETPWKFIASTEVPDLDLCTAAFCIVTYQGRLVLVEHASRGYEFTGGHVDQNESILDAVVREVREEGCAVIREPRLFGYKKVSPEQPIPHRDNTGGFYPFPHSYTPYYHAEALELLDNDHMSDIKGIRLAEYQEALSLLQPTQKHNLLLDYLMTNKLITLK